MGRPNPNRKQLRGTIMTNLATINHTLSQIIDDDMRNAYAATTDKYLFALDNARYFLDLALPMNSDFTDRVVEQFETMLEREPS
jgi:hypothetical protein